MTQIVASIISIAASLLMSNGFKTDTTDKILDVKMDAETQQIVYELCDDYNIDFCLCMAVIQKESSFRPKVISKSRCYGLMQIHAINHDRLEEELGINDFLDPVQNVEAGLYMLKELFEKYEDTPLVLMAYNMGESKAKKKWKKEIYTSSYAEDVMRIQQEFYEELGW